jgi:hypothetical protein
MRELLRELWQDERGCVAAAEWVFVATILVLGAVTGLAVREGALGHGSDLPALLTSLAPEKGVATPASPP